MCEKTLCKTSYGVVYAHFFLHVWLNHSAITKMLSGIGSYASLSSFSVFGFSWWLQKQIVLAFFPLNKCLATVI